MKSSSTLQVPGAGKRASRRRSGTSTVNYCDETSTTDQLRADTKTASRKRKSDTLAEGDGNDSDDSDFEAIQTSFRSPKPGSESSRQKQKRVKIVSSDNESDTATALSGARLTSSNILCLCFHWLFRSVTERLSARHFIQYVVFLF